MLAAARQAAKRAAQNARHFQTSAVKMGGHDGPAYLHAKSMYDIQSIKNRKLKYGLAIGGTVFLGCAVPWIAAQVQFARAKG